MGEKYCSQCHRIFTNSPAKECFECAIPLEYREETSSDEKHICSRCARPSKYYYSGCVECGGVLVPRYASGEEKLCIIEREERRRGKIKETKNMKNQWENVKFFIFLVLLIPITYLLAGLFLGVYNFMSHVISGDVPPMDFLRELFSYSLEPVNEWIKNMVSGG